MSEEKKPSVVHLVAKLTLYGILLLVLGLFLLVIAARSQYLLLVPYHLIFGWISHGWKELPSFFGKWEAAIFPSGCLLLAGVLAHRFVLRWMVEKKPSLVWRVKHTAAAMGLILLFSAAAIATSGIFHQFFWLSSGKVIESNRRSELTVAINNGRQLMLALMEFQLEHDRYPNSLDELDEQAFNLNRLIWVDISGATAPEPFILLKPGSTEIVSAKDPVIVSPLMEKGGKAIVGYGDMSVRMVSGENLEAILEQAKVAAGEEK